MKQQTHKERMNSWLPEQGGGWGSPGAGGEQAQTTRDVISYKIHNTEV